MCSAKPLQNDFFDSDATAFTKMEFQKHETLL